MYALLIAVMGVTALIIATIQLFQPSAQELKVEFIPKEMKSCPEHIAWLLVNITIVGNPNVPLSISVHPNRSIQTQYHLWSTSTPKVLEIFLYPNTSHINSNIGVEVRVTTDTVSATDVATVHVVDWTLPDLTQVTDIRNTFVQFLAINHPDFGIDETVTWTPTLNAPQILVVEHYLFMSEFWEMELSRHVMIAPHDWIRVYLRPRGALTPSWAGMIESWTSDNQTILEIEPPDQIYR